MRRWTVLVAVFVSLITVTGPRHCEAEGTVTLVLQGDFAPGNDHFDASGFQRLSRTIRLWESWHGDDRHTGTLKLGPFSLDHIIELYLAGFAGQPGLVLALEDAATGQRLNLAPRQQPVEHWSRFRWSIPSEWQHRSVFLVAEDNSSELGRWLGVSEPLSPTANSREILWLALDYLVVFAVLLLPGIAFLGWVPLRGTRLSSERALIAIVLGSATLTYPLFFAYVGHRYIGRAASWSLLIASIATIIVHRRALYEAVPWRQVITLLSFCYCVALLYSAVLFMYGGVENPPLVSFQRFLNDLPPDPILPDWVSTRLYRGEPLRPFVNDWLASDRPPLQSAFYLAVYPLIPHSEIYQFVGTTLQVWIFLAVWVWLRKTHAPNRVIAWVLFFSVFAGFFLINSTYVWPKLLPAAFLVLAASFILSDREDLGTMTGACIGLALLGHGGSMFGLIGLFLCSLLYLRRQSIRFWSMALLITAVYMAPWVFYQKLYDPPGDRLAKWWLAGVVEVDGRSFPRALRDAYSSQSARMILRARWENAKSLIVVPDLADKPNQIASIIGGDSVSANRFARALRNASFRTFIRAPGPLLLGLAGFLWMRHTYRQRELTRLMTFATTLLLTTTLVWCGLMFIPGSTQNHQGSYFNNVVMFVILGVGAALMPPILRWLLAVINLAWFSAVWVLRPPVREGVLLPTTEPSFVVLAVVSAIATVSLLVLIGRERSDN